MKKSSLVYKLIVRFAGVLTVVIFSIAIILSLWFKDFFFEQKKYELERQSSIISTAAVAHITLEQPSSLNNLKKTLNLVSSSMNVDILVTDNLGITYAVSNEKHEDVKITNIGISDEDMKRLKNGETIEHGGIVSLDVSKYTYLKPVFDGDYFGGVIVMITSEESIRNALTQVYKIVWLMGIGAIMISVGVMYYFSKKLIVNSLSELNIAANKLAKGEVEKRVEVRSDDEIGELARSFNIMAESLEEVEKNRKDFISNVSHELRSPITSVKGFIAGILDGVIPKDKENYYLNIVYDEINRLSRLVGDLLDISAMEDGKFKLNMIGLDINMLIKLCLVNLEGKIAEKDLNVEVVLENEDEFVYADRDRIIQVITNLLDNAIKYNENGGFIKVTTKVRGNKVYISIYNTGRRMSEEQIIRIWDRFYKADKSRTNKESTGLGLPIVRLILTQHGQDIWVKNEKDGVKFTFTLDTK
ncbi:ATP-binding protein [Clostridium paraputrificum]|uniref:sensor histidine kinase n=1 Tax=Clostridium paraputrificum TaxID=29363 RepID=UPI003D359750